MKKPFTIEQLPDPRELTKEEVDAIFEQNAAFKKDADDKRCLRGRHTPRPFPCRVCSGLVAAEVSFPDDGRIGGPPRHAYISGWHCESCQLMYRRRPSEPAVDSDPKWTEKLRSECDD